MFKSLTASLCQGLQFHSQLAKTFENRFVLLIQQLMTRLVLVVAIQTDAGNLAMLKDVCDTQGNRQRRIEVTSVVEGLRQFKCPLVNGVGNLRTKPAGERWQYERPNCIRRGT